jgi:hypothetical protein
VTTGNIPNQALLALFRGRFTQTVEDLASGTAVVEIGCEAS